MKLLIVSLAIFVLSLQASAAGIRGGDLPFPIGKIIDFPKDDGKGVWKDELKKKIIRLRPLKGVLDEDTILVQMLGLNKRIIAEGFGEVGQDKILNARLRFISQRDKYVDIRIANLCADATFDNNTDLSEMCEQPQMWAAMQIFDEEKKFGGETESFMIRKTSEQ